MDVQDALALVWIAAGRSSQRVVAGEIRVPPSAITNWKAGTVPTGGTRKRLLEWAEKYKASEEARTPPAVVREVASTYDADPVERLVREGQRELAGWVREFSARLMEANAQRVRSTPLPDWITEDELAGDLAAADRLADARQAHREGRDSPPEGESKQASG